jgi:hypothetical protein
LPTDPLDDAEAHGRQPLGFQQPQIITEGVLRKTRKSAVITFKLRVLRVLELTFLVTVPEEGTTRAPVYVRFWLDRSAEDKPGTVVIGRAEKRQGSRNGNTHPAGGAGADLDLDE